MSRRGKSGPVRYNERISQLDKMTTKESDWDALALAASLRDMSEEEQIEMLARLDIDAFRRLLKYYRPNERMVKLIATRRKRLRI